MKRTLVFSVLSVFAGMAGNVLQVKAEDHKTVICHVPPGDPDNAHTIVVDSHALPAHLDHGDYLGQCEVIPPIVG